MVALKNICKKLNYFTVAFKVINSIYVFLGMATSKATWQEA